MTLTVKAKEPFLRARSVRRCLTEPRLIVEILSPSTTPRDRMLKLDGNREISTLQELVDVSPLEHRIQLWRRTGDPWRVYDLIGDASLRLESIGATISRAAIYEKVALSPAGAESDRAAVFEAQTARSLT